MQYRCRCREGNDKSTTDNGQRHDRSTDLQPGRRARSTRSRSIEAKLGGEVRQEPAQAGAGHVPRQPAAGHRADLGPRRSRRLDPQDVPPEGHRQRPHGRHPQPDQEGRRPRQAEASQGMAAGHAQEGPPRWLRDSATAQPSSRATTFACSTRSSSMQPKTKLVAADVQGAGHRPQLPACASTAATKTLEKSARNIDRTTLTTVRPAQRVGHPAQSHAAADQGGLETDSGVTACVARACAAAECRETTWTTQTSSSSRWSPKRARISRRRAMRTRSRCIASANKHADQAGGREAVRREGRGRAHA